MTGRRSLGALLLGAILFLAPAASAPVAVSTPAPALATATAARVHNFTGVVTAVHGHQWFRMRTARGGRVRIYTTPATRWEGCDWSDMHDGYGVRVRARHGRHHWIAVHMQGSHHSGHHGDPGAMHD